MVVPPSNSKHIHSEERYIKSTSQLLTGAGNYEYPFETLLPDDAPDSVEGLPGGAIIYKMKAIVERAGLVNKNITCRKV